MPLAQSPVKDQDGIGICDHYAAMEIFDAYRFYKNGKRYDKHVSSAIASAAILSNRVEGPDGIEHVVMETILKHTHSIGGTCDENRVLDELGKSENISHCRDLQFVINSWKPNRERTASSSANGSTNNCQISRKSGDYDGLEVLAKFTQSDNNGARAQLAKDVSDNFRMICLGATVKVDKLMPINTHGHKNKFSTEIERKNRNQKLKSQIDQALDDNKPMPPGIRYCMHVLTSANFVGIEGSTGSMTNCVLNQKNGAHASVIVGRRPSRNGGTCQYLIKNSHGVSCNKYDRRWECDKTKGGQPCPPGEQCGGQIWVDEDALLNNLQDVVRVEAP